MNTLTTIFVVALVASASVWASTAIVFGGGHDIISQAQDAISATPVDPVIAQPGGVMQVCEYRFAQTGQRDRDNTLSDGHDMDFLNLEIPRHRDVPKDYGEVVDRKAIRLETSC